MNLNSIANPLEKDCLAFMTRKTGQNLSLLRALFTALEENTVAIHQLGIIEEWDFMEAFLEDQAPELEAHARKDIIEAYYNYIKA